ADAGGAGEDWGRAGHGRPRRPRGNEGVIGVEDNGPGRGEELADQVFEAFFTTQGDSGNGLGLWISSEIARMHGGSLTVHRGSLGGALFRLSLPIDARTSPELRAEATTSAHL